MSRLLLFFHWTVAPVFYCLPVIQRNEIKGLACRHPPLLSSSRRLFDESKRPKSPTNPVQNNSKLRKVRSIPWNNLFLDAAGLLSPLPPDLARNFSVDPVLDIPGHMEETHVVLLAQLCVNLTVRIMMRSSNQLRELRACRQADKDITAGK
ncbi:hypothetical protein B0H16DRAFT_1476993 [Mycena metata]|uniref:Uncharacterized protein n=1 Tax=Mycena metata TaxID=1033252 RepID=A0AAD7MGL6_9AGAR|nr:hypothetical protein B0H16DRAFT_1476993 [Mycena metata]